MPIPLVSFNGNQRKIFFFLMVEVLTPSRPGYKSQQGCEGGVGIREPWR